MYLKTLGGLRLEGSTLHRPKPLLLLTYLALEGPRSRRYISELFYRDTSDPMNNLSRALSHFRGQAPGVIDANNKTIWVNLSCDANDLLNLTSPNHSEKANELYHGAFVMDYNLPLGEELEEWLYATREILANKARQCFLSLAEQELQHSHLDKAATLAEKAYRLNDSVLEHDDFARVYKLLKITHSPLAANLLKEAKELDISLDYALVQIPALQDIPLSQIDTPHNLPLTKTSFVGREQELNEIKQKLSQNDCHLLTLHGMGGIGKSRTSIEVAYQHLQQTLFPDGVYFIALDGIRSGSQIPLTISENLYMDMLGNDDVLVQVKNYISEKHMLLILDNFEHLIDAATLPSDLLASCPNLKIIITSREVLNVDEEWVKNLEGLRYPSTVIPLDEALNYEAITLFSQRAKKSKLEFSPTEDNISTIIQICQLVEGVPLALELAATWVRFMTLEDIAQQIKTNLNFLATQSRNAYERHKSIRAVFEHSWQLLNPKEQEVFRKLSVFVGSFNRQAAAEVAGATLPILTSLVNKSLLRVMPSGRYSRHFLIHELSQEKLKDDPEEFAGVQQGHASYYLHFLSSNREDILGVNQQQVLQEMDFETDNIYVAWPHMYMAEDSELLHLAINTLGDFLSMKGRAKEGVELFSSALNFLDSKNSTAILILATLNKVVAWLYRDMGNLVKARSYAERSLSLLENSPYAVELGPVLRTLAIVCMRQADFVTSKTLYERELEIYKCEGNVRALGLTLNNLGFLYIYFGQYEKAEINLLEGVEIARQLETLAGLVDNLDSLATLYLSINNSVKAETAFRESLEIARNIEYLGCIPTLLNGLGRALLQQGKCQEANRILQEGLKLARVNKNEMATMSIFTTLAMSKIETNDFNQVESHLVRAISIGKILDDKSELFVCLLEVSKYLIKQDKLELALYLAQYITSSSFVWKVVRDQADKLLEFYRPKIASNVLGTHLMNPSTELEKLVIEIVSEIPISSVPIH
jgi:predicted ATPase